MGKHGQSLVKKTLLLVMVIFHSNTFDGYGYFPQQFN